MMPTPPFASAIVSRNGGGNQSGGITGSVGDVAQLHLGSTQAINVQRWDLVSVPPGYTVPASWLTDTDGTFYSLAATPPPFSLSIWGKYAVVLRVGDALTNKNADPKLTDLTLAIDVVSPNGLHDQAQGESNQFGTSWLNHHAANLRTIDSVLGAVSGVSVASPVADLTALRAVLSTNRADNQMRAVGTTPGNWIYSVGSGAGFADDGKTIVKPVDVLVGANGRWYNTAASPTVPTITALRAAISGKHERVRVLAFSTLGDGGGGEFYWDSTSTATDDGGTIITPTGLATGRWKRQVENEFNVLWFGGVRNDTGTSAKAANVTAFGACNTAAKAAKKSVLIPWGDYSFTAGAGVDISNTGSQLFRFRGDGKSRTRLLFSSTDDCVFANTCKNLIASDFSVVGTSCARGLNVGGSGTDLGPVHIQDIEVTGMTAAPVSGLTAGIRLFNVNDGYVERCDVYGNGYANVSGDAEINGYGNGVDILIDTFVDGNKRMHVNGNVVTSGHTAQAILMYDCYHSEATHNKVYGNNTPGVRAKNRSKPIHHESTQDDASGYGIALYQHSLDPTYNVVAFNYVEETAGSGIYLQANSQDVVQGNVVKNCARYQLDNQLPVGGIAANYGPNTYTGNIVLNPGGDTAISDGLPQGNPPPACGYDVQGNHNDISGGHVDSASKTGVRINGVFSNNTVGGGIKITNCGTGISNLAGNKLTRFSLNHVIIDVTTNAGVAIDSADDFTATNVTVVSPGAQGIAVGGDSGGSTRATVLGCHVHTATADYAFMIRATNSRVEKCTAPASTRGLLLGTASSGCDASGSAMLHNDFRDATTTAISVTGTDIQTEGNRTPIGIESLPSSRGGVVYVRGASSATHTLTGALTENGITYATGDRYLAKDQGTPAQNGVYVVNTGGGINWQRAPEFDSSEDIRAGTIIRVGDEDTTNGGSTWRLVTAGPYTIGSTSLSFRSTDLKIFNNVASSVALIGDSLQNTTAAAAGVQQWSPIREQVAQGWKTDSTAASETVAGGVQTRSVQSTAHPTGQFHVMFNVNAAGYISVAHFDSDGSLSVGPSGSTFPTLGTIRVPNTGSVHGLDHLGNDVRMLYIHTDDNVYIPGFYSASSGSLFTWLAPTAQFDTTVTSPKLTQADNVTNSATAQPIGVIGQKATGTTSIGGHAYLQPGTGTSTNGEAQIRGANGVNVIRVANGAWAMGDITPTASQAWSAPTNHVDARTLDETGATTAQVANALGTLINDLRAKNVLA